MSVPVLATKLHAPVHRGRLIARARLVDTLDELFAPGHRLALVSAPAGFGKTTLVSTWSASASASAAAAEGVRRPPTGVAWVSLDDGDNHLGRLLAHVVEALVRAGAPVLVDPAAGTSAAMDAAAATGLLATVVDRLERSSDTLVDARAEARRHGTVEQGQSKATPVHGWLLVLDDYHVITNQEVHETLTYLLDHQPERLRVLIATRADPPLPLARMRTRGQLVEVRASDLRFTHEEAGDFFRRTMQLDLAPGHVRALDDRTEGWVAGLQLAGLSLRGRTDTDEVADFVDAFTGSNRFVVDYLADEVLAGQPEEVRTFLLRTSVLHRLTGPLCDAVTGASGGSQMLARLDRENLFVVPLDDDRAWYRYHHLFADVLHARLLALAPHEVPHLHRAASDWYAACDETEEAVRHALAAGDHGRAGRLVERGLADLRRQRRDALMLTWLRALPDDVVRPNPVLSSAAGWAAMVAGDLEGVARHLDDADAALAAAAANPSVAAAWEDTDDLATAAAGVHLYRAALAQARGNPAGTETHARAALDLARPQDQFIRGGGSGFLGLAAWSRGDVTEALRTFEQAAESLRAAGNDVDALDTTVVLADMWVTAGYPSRARDLCERSLAAATAHGEPYPRAAADLHTWLGELAVARGDLREAEGELRTAAALAERARITENRHRWPVAAAALHAASGDHRTASDLLREASEQYRPGFYPEVRPIDAMRARFALMAGETRLAERWADQCTVRLDDAPEFLREYEHLTLVRLVLAQQRLAFCHPGAPRTSPLEARLLEADGMLQRLEVAATRSARLGSVLEIRMLQAMVHAATGHLTAAVDLLASALEAAPEVAGYRQLFLYEGAAMTTLLEQVAALPASGASGVRSRARRLLAHDAVAGSDREGPAEARSDEVVASPPGLPQPLSEREREVLSLLPSELSGPDIARQLFISLNTLRTHTKHIFTKLDVTSRAAAVRRARDVGLL